MSDAALIAALLAIDTKGLGGVWVRARHGPRREALLSALEEIPGEAVQVRPGMDEHALFGGVDLTASLTSGCLVTANGVLKDASVLHLSQGERISARLGARIAARFEQLKRCAIVLLDEGTDDDGLPLQVLRERLAFFLHEGSDVATPIDVGDAAARVHDVILPEELMAECVLVAARLGVSGMRPMLFAAAAAKANAALNGRETTQSEDLEVAVRLVFGHRATVAPETATQENLPPPPVEEDGR